MASDIHYCAAVTCPGYPYRASDRAHPCPNGETRESIVAAFRALRSENAELRRERDGWVEIGRTQGRSDVAKYSNAIGQIESIVGISGAAPMQKTVAAVRDLRARAEAAEAREAELRAERDEARGEAVDWRSVALGWESDEQFAQCMRVIDRALAGEKGGA